jgi:hypothetical protein
MSGRVGVHPARKREGDQARGLNTTAVAWVSAWTAEQAGGEDMAEPQELDGTFHFIMQRFVEQGQAPHYTEMAKAFSVPPEEGRRRLHELMNSGLPLPIWLYPGTDLITSFSPFHNLPTQYRISVDGHQKWFGQ